MYIFSAGHFSVDNQYICSFQGKTTSPALSSVHLPAVFHVGLRPHVLFLSTLACSLMSLAILLMRLYKHGFWFYSEIKILQQTFSFPGFYNLLPPLPQFPCVRVFYRFINWNWATNLCILIGYVFLQWFLSGAKTNFLNVGWRLHLSEVL